MNAKDPTATHGQRNTEGQATQGGRCLHFSSHETTTKGDRPGAAEGWYLPDDTSVAL